MKKDSLLRTGSQVLKLSDMKFSQFEPQIDLKRKQQSVKIQQNPIDVKRMIFNQKEEHKNSKLQARPYIEQGSTTIDFEISAQPVLFVSKSKQFNSQLFHGPVTRKEILEKEKQLISETDIIYINQCLNFDFPSKIVVHNINYNQVETDLSVIHQIESLFVGKQSQIQQRELPKKSTSVQQQKQLSEHLSKPKSARQRLPINQQKQQRK
ncbi:hypothetical protein SS50377_20545 [Spironucleus salmonicida]|uniref:Uncharacterized protein n=1 Tax=Spironucleus salmonicida TaxID=348837 RepID=V6LU06_9EUKA|nr:hypothetical protein SS50377_20545 [Spironucleus salmonicida]|eukprot:EST48090.1 Hypothetical protein SS50377_11788 [Spironucleus salmonicida]